jgi:formylmethanofuran dehydrogenase subunit E
VRVLDVLLHELIHAIMPGQGHRRGFSQLAAKMGLVKPWTATTAGPELHARLTKMAKRLGEFEHSPVSDATRKKQTTRMLKVECPKCGYLVRTTRKMLDVGNPLCPQGDEMWEV